MSKTLSKHRTRGSNLLVLSLAVFFINILAVSQWSTNVFAQVPGVTPTSMPTGGCAIDGDLLARTPTTAPFSSSNGDFLENPSAPGTGGGVFTNPGGLAIDPTTAFHIVDGVGNGDQNIFSTGSKFNDNPNTWTWTTGSPPNKDDMNHALFHFATDPEGHTWFMGGGDRSGVNGTSYLDFELLQNRLTKNANGSFTSAGPDGGRTVGDIVITVEYSNGGTNAQIIAYRWTQTSPGVFSYVVFTPPAGTTYAASNINGPVSVPFGAFGSTTYQQYAYAEAAFDINEIIPGLNNCIGAKTVLIKTKASDALTAALKDFVEPVQLELGSIPTVHVNSPTICTGQSATLTANVTFGVGPFTYLWTPGGQTTSSITVSPTSTTAYSVMVTGLSGCPSIPDTGIVTVSPGITCSITGANGPVCPSASNVYSAQAGMSSYAWSITGAGTIIGATNLQTVTVQTSSACNSSFDLMLNVTNSTGCSSTCDKTVTIQDVTPPALTGSWPANVSGVNSCMANAPAGPSDASIAALYSDGCSAVTVTHTVSPSGTDCSWSLVYTYTIKDNCNNVVAPAPTFTVSGADLTAPALTGSWPTNVTGVNNCKANAPAGPSDATIAALYTDGCGGTISVTHTAVPSGTDCAWSVLYSYTIMDKCSNTVTPAPMFTVSGADLTAPTLTGSWPSNITGVNTCMSNAPAGPSDAAIADLYTDACSGIITVTHTSVPSGTDCGWSVLYSYSIMDKCGNTVTPAPTFTVSGADHTAPALTGSWPSNITGVNNCMSNAPSGPSDATIAALYTDGCGGTISVTHTAVPSGTDCAWNVLYSYTIMDKCGNTVTPAPMFTVSGADLTAPTLTSSWPSNVTGVNNCMANAPVGPSDAAIAALYTDGCGGIITVTHTAVPSGTDCAWSVLYSYTIMDKCGNTVTPAPMFTVSGADHTAPTLTGSWPSNITGVNNCRSNAPAGPSDATIAALYTDACSGTISVSHTSVPSGTDCAWSVLYSYTIMDKCGNTVTPAPTFTVSGADHTAPALTGSWPSNITGVNNCMSNAPAGPTNAAIAALYTDACGGTISVTHTSVPSGTDCSWNVLYTYTIMDKCGNTVTPAPTFTVSGADQTAPVLTGTWLPNITAVNSCDATPPANPPGGPTDADVAALYTDACGGTITVTHTTTPSGNDCSWSILYTYTIKDKCGNTVTPAPTFTVNGGDLTGPALTGTWPSNVTGVNSCKANAPAGPSDAAIAALYTDACGGTITVTHTTNPSGTDCSWNVLYTYTIMDKCGNTVTPAPTFTVSGADLTAPALTGTWPSNITSVNNCMSNAPAGPSDASIAALYSDGCSAVTVTHTVTPNGTDCSWSLVYTYIIKDNCNNVVTPAPTFTVSGADLTAPVLTGSWPSNITSVNNCMSNAPAGPSDATIAALYTDGCGGTISVTHNAVPSGIDCSWNVLYTYTIMDKCGNTVTPAPTFTVSGGDLTAPALTGSWPSNITSVNNCMSNAPAGPSDAAIASLYTDGCGGTIMVTHNSVPNGTDCSWSVLYTYTIMDKCGNTVTPAPTFTVSGTDLTPPVLSGNWPSNVTGVNNCMSNAPAGPSDAAIAALYTDACGGTINVTHNAVPSGTDCSWSLLYSYTIMDKCGNIVSPAPTFTVSGGDLTAPVLTGNWPSNITGVNNCMSNAPAGPSDAAIASLYTDGCGGTIMVTHNSVPNGTDCSWSVLYTYTIMDKCGNIVSPAPTFTVSGADHTAPALTSTWPSNITGVNNCISNAPAGPSDAAIAALYTDACGGTISVTHTSVPNGTDCSWSVLYTYTIMDKCGNTVAPAPTFTVSGADLTPPVLTNLPPSVINFNCDGNPVTIQSPSATDNCDPAPQVICLTNNCNGPFLPGTTIVTFQAIDVCGNKSNPYSVTVNVSSPPPCLIGEPTCGIPFNYMTGNSISVDPSINLANIVSYSWTLSGPGGWLITGASANNPAVIYTAGTGTGVFTLTLVDINGCSATCKKDITVQIADEYCTVTQDYWVNLGIKQDYLDNPGGSFCNTGDKLTYMNHLLGNTGLLVGCGVNTMYFAPGEAQCITNLLPGGGSPGRILGTNTCANHPGIQTINGRINNVLLAQNITLGLNMRIKPNLAKLALDSPTLEVANSSGCMGAPPVDNPIACTVVSYGFPKSVNDLLISMYGPFPTVANLFDLANKALGSCSNISPGMFSPINDAVTMINEKFDGCKWATFQGNGSNTNPVNSGIDPITPEDQPAQINLSVMPNPFANSTAIKFSVSKSSHVTLELYNIMGSKIATLVDQNVNADETITYPYTADAALGSGMFICILRTEYGNKVTRMLMTH